MNPDWLLLDAPNLCWRMFHTFNAQGDPLRDTDGRPVATIYGFLRDVSFLAHSYRCDRVAVCFDGVGSYRQKEFPDYKNGRKPKTPQEEKNRAVVREQIARLRDEILPELGFKNVFAQDGVEADDVIAKICRDYDDKELLIISNDKDLYQCLAPHVQIWNYRRRLTYQGFHAEYGIEPAKWADVKAISGCASDGVKGVKGVGEITALKYVVGTLSAKSAFTKRIWAAGGEFVERNMKLVALPHPKTKGVKLIDRAADAKAWDAFATKHNMKSLRGACPSVMAPRAGVRS